MRSRNRANSGIVMLARFLQRRLCPWSLRLQRFHQIPRGPTCKACRVRPVNRPHLVRFGRPAMTFRSKTSSTSSIPCITSPSFRQSIALFRTTRLDSAHVLSAADSMVDRWVSWHRDSRPSSMRSPKVTSVRSSPAGRPNPPHERSRRTRRNATIPPSPLGCEYRTQPAARRPKSRHPRPSWQAWYRVDAKRWTPNRFVLRGR